MLISLGADGSLVVDRAQDFGAFAFGGPQRPQPQSQAVIFEDGYAWVSEVALREWPETANDPAWRAGLDKMVAYAASKGWFDPASGRIRAHIEPPDAG